MRKNASELVQYVLLNSETVKEILPIYELD